MIDVAAGISVDEKDIVERFVLASGPGGQHVNKNATAVQLQLDVTCVRGISETARIRLVRLAGKRLSSEGVLTIVSRLYRSQARNREDALRRLIELIRRSLQQPVKRRPTRPTKGSQQRRLDQKGQRGSLKKSRKKPGAEE